MIGMQPVAIAAGVDGSPEAHVATRWAAELAGRWACSLMLVHAGAGPVEPPWLTDMADEFAAHVRMVEAPTPLSTEQLAEALVQAAGSARLLALGGRAGPAHRVLAARCALSTRSRGALAVAVVPAGPVALDASEGVLVGLGGGDSDYDVAVVRTGAALAAAWATPVTLVHAWTDPVHERQERDRRPREGLVAAAAATVDSAVALAHTDAVADVRTRLVEGNASRALLDASVTARAVVVGLIGGEEPPGPQTGATSEALLTGAPCPVVLVTGRSLTP